MRKVAAAAALLAFAVCGCSTITGNHTAVQAVPQQIHTGRLMVGAAANSYGGFVAAVGVKPVILEHYIHVGDSFTWDWAGSAIPLIQIEPYRISVAAVAHGQEDDWLRSYAHSVAAYRKAIILGFAPEMNGDWYAWGYNHVAPATYIAAWRHVVSVFRAQGARNVTWLWTVNISELSSNSSTPRVSSIGQWWPGGNWVTWVGIDGYYYTQSQSFSTLFGHTLREIDGLTSQPVLVSETSAAPTADQAAKIADLFNGARNAGLIGVVWFDLKGNRDWELDTAASIVAFRQAANG